MSKKWKMDTARSIQRFCDETAPRIADALETIASSMESNERDVSEVRKAAAEHVNSEEDSDD